MNKRGISPLIATVLIIGFTIVLATLVLQWSGDLFKDVQSDTAETSEFKIACASKLVGLKVSANREGNNINIMVDNKNDFEDLLGARVRLYGVGGKLINFEDNKFSGEDYVTPAFSLMEIQISDTAEEEYEIGILPIISVKGVEKTCENEFKAAIENV